MRGKNEEKGGDEEKCQGGERKCRVREDDMKKGQVKHEEERKREGDIRCQERKK